MIHNLCMRLWINVQLRFRPLDVTSCLESGHARVISQRIPAQLTYLHSICTYILAAERAKSGCGLPDHQSVDPLEVFQRGELDDDTASIRAHVDLYSGVEMIRQQLLELEHTGRA